MLKNKWVLKKNKKTKTVQVWSGCLFRKTGMSNEFTGLLRSQRASDMAGPYAQASWTGSKQSKSSTWNGGLVKIRVSCYRVCVLRLRVLCIDWNAHSGTEQNIWGEGRMWFHTRRFVVSKRLVYLLRWKQDEKTVQENTRKCGDAL